LDAEFDSGGIYRYFNVYSPIFDDLAGASSQGTYFNANIRNDFSYEKLE